MDTEETKNDIEEIDDVVFEEEGEETNLQAKIKKLRDELKKASKERDEYLTGWQRARADFVNARKEEDKTRAEFTKYANKDLLLEILSVMDSFDMAFANKEAWEKVDKNWRMGVEYIHGQLLGILEQNELKQVNPAGETFDSNIHTSIESVLVEKEEDDHTIREVIQKGYTLHGSLVRSPKVKVGVWEKK